MDLKKDSRLAVTAVAREMAGFIWGLIDGAITTKFGRGILGQEMGGEKMITGNPCRILEATSFAKMMILVRRVKAAPDESIVMRLTNTRISGLINRRQNFSILPLIREPPRNRGGK